MQYDAIDTEGISDWSLGSSKTVHGESSCAAQSTVVNQSHEDSCEERGWKSTLAKLRE